MLGGRLSDLSHDLNPRAEGSRATKAFAGRAYPSLEDKTSRF